MNTRDEVLEKIVDQLQVLTPALSCAYHDARRHAAELLNALNAAERCSELLKQLQPRK